MGWKQPRSKTNVYQYAVKLLATEDQWLAKKQEIASRNGVIIQEGFTPYNGSLLTGKVRKNYWARVQMENKEREESV